MNPARLKAFVLDLGDGPDVGQARAFLEALGLGLFLEPVEVDASSLNVDETIRVIEDYKALDVQSATMAMALCRGVRQRYPDVALPDRRRRRRREPQGLSHRAES